MHDDPEGTSRHPVLVVGGGPAGATFAALLAKEGVPVLLLERAVFPRYNIGESLQPATIEILEHHLGLGAAIASQGFARKFGAVYTWGKTREPWSVLFDERLEVDLPGLNESQLLAGGYELAWQVERARFDALILEEAVRVGVQVRQEVEVLEPVFGEEGRVVGVRVKTGDGGNARRRDRPVGLQPFGFEKAPGQG